jgi:hypothetical protein
MVPKAERRLIGAAQAAVPVHERIEAAAEDLPLRMH